MSIPVPVAGLRAAVAERGDSAYVLTVSNDGYPHAVHGPVCWEGDVLAVDAGRRTLANAAARPSVSLLYPVRGAGDYSLIVDGTAVVESSGDRQRLLVTPLRAVLHRPAATAQPTTSPSPSCGADCVPLLSSTPEPPRPRGHEGS